MVAQVIDENTLAARFHVLGDDAKNDSDENPRATMSGTS